jgi:Domain of unknown function (DUF1918)
MPANDAKKNAKKKTAMKQRAGTKAATAKPKGKAGTSTKPAARTATGPTTTPAKPGDLIVIESEKVGSPPREGEVLEIFHGQVSVSYRVQWQDGHQSVIAPGAGNTSIVPAQRKR